jgi:hypothetical protein
MDARPVATTAVQHKRSWSRICILGVRIAFGGIWAVNTVLLTRYLTVQASSAYVQQMILSSQQAGQHSSSWGGFWQHVAVWHPTGFVLLCIAAMGFVACGLLFGLFTNLICVMGGICAFFFWSTQLVNLLPIGVPAGDTGVLLVFLLAFLGLSLSGAGQICGLDRIVANIMGRWSFLASGTAGNVRRVRTFVPNAVEIVPRRVQPSTFRPNASSHETRVRPLEREAVGASKHRFNAK